MFFLIINKLKLLKNKNLKWRKIYKNNYIILNINNNNNNILFLN